MTCSSMPALSLRLGQGSRKAFLHALCGLAKWLEPAHCPVAFSSALHTVLSRVLGPQVDRRQEKPQDTRQPRLGPESHLALGRNKKPIWPICPEAFVIAKASGVLRVGSCFSWK